MENEELVELRGKIHPFDTYHIDAYNIAVRNGFQGTEAEWLESLKGGCGGYYKPSVSQPDESTMVISFIPSATGMDEISPREITISKGARGADGKDGATPHIGENGNWFIGDTDTGIQADYSAHLNNKENPHGVTAEQVGAAPATESTDYPGCYYRIVNGETEWINPPMVYGIEYRTAERFGGKPVYACALHYDELANSGEYVNKTLQMAPTTIIDISGTIIDSVGVTYPLPAFSTSGNLIATVRKTGGYTIIIYSFADLSNYSGVVNVKYTKE